jgi:hypothetical protein
MTTKHRLIRLLDVTNREGSALAPAVGPMALRTPQDVLDLLEEQINALRADRWTSPAVKARTIGRLAAVVVKTLEVTQLAARLEVLETVLKQRGEENPR